MKYLSLFIAIFIFSACTPQTGTTEKKEKETKKEVKKEVKTNTSQSEKEAKKELKKAPIKKAKKEKYNPMPGKIVDDTVMAKFAGQNILFKDIKKSYPAELKKAQDEYLKKNYEAISLKVNTFAIEKMLNAEAKKQGFKTHKELLDKITASVKPASQKEIAEMKKKYASQFAAKKMDAKKITKLVEEYIMNQKKNDIAFKFLEKIKKESKFKISLPYPNIPILKINISENDPYKGNKDAKYVIVEFSDFQCPYCSRVAPTIAGVVKNNKDVKVVFKHFPLSFHKMAKKASIATQCANNQDKFWEFHNKIFANQKDLNDVNLKKWAKELKLDMTKYNKCLTSTETKTIVENAVKDGVKIGVQGTPSLFLNGVQVNAGTPDMLDQIIQAERDKVRGELTNDTVIISFTGKSFKWSDFLAENKNFDIITKTEKIKKDYELYAQLLSRELSKLILDKAAKDMGFKDTNEYMGKILEKIKSPSEKELKDLYEKLKPKLQGKSFNEIKPQLIQYNKKMKSQTVIQNKMRELSEKYNVEVVMPLPLLPALEINIKGSAVMGNKDAKYTLVEFSDFECPYCSKASKFTEEILKKFPNKVKVVFKHFPLPFHKNARFASVASECANQQGKFRLFHNKLFANQKNLKESNFIAIATELKLDIEKFKKCLNDDSIAKKIDQDMKEGQELGVQGTPTMYLNGVLYRSAHTIEEFSKLIK